MTRFDNAGKLARNRKKDPSNPDHAKWADFKGDAMIEGHRYWISGWIREHEGKKFFGLAFTKYVAKDAKTP